MCLKWRLPSLPFTKRKKENKTTLRGLRGGSLVKNLPASAGDISWSGKVPLAAEQQSLCATTTEPAL